MDKFIAICQMISIIIGGIGAIIGFIAQNINTMLISIALILMITSINSILILFIAIENRKNKGV